MSRLSSFVISLPEADRAELQRRARCYTAPHAQVVRAKIVLLAVEGLANTRIAARLDVHVNVVGRWRRRFAEEGLAGLDDRKRPGWPRVFAAAVVAQVKAMACEPPESRGVPQSRWSAADLAGQAAAEGLVAAVSRSTVQRWLEEDAIRPWRYRSWIFPRDPQFAVKAGRVLDLYQRIWESRELGDGEYVISTDEKSQLQVHACPASAHTPCGRPGCALLACSSQARDWGHCDLLDCHTGLRRARARALPAACAQVELVNYRAATSGTRCSRRSRTIARATPLPLGWPRQDDRPSSLGEVISPRLREDQRDSSATGQLHRSWSQVAWGQQTTIGRLTNPRTVAHPEQVFGLGQSVPGPSWEAPFPGLALRCRTLV